MTPDISTHLKNWIPYKLVNIDGELFCRWLYVNEKRFIEPFFDETVAKCLSFESNSKKYRSISNIAFLQQCSTVIQAAEPAAFIFHVSRCGSTTISQLLATHQDHIVLSEVTFFDELLRLRYRTKQFVDELLLKAAITMYSQKRTREENRAFIKTDSWHIFFHQQIRRLYPNTPFILMYRSPDEVLNSHKKRRGMHVVPGIIEKEIFGFTADDVEGLDLDAYAIRVIEKYFEEYLSVIKNDKNALLINYSEGMLEIVGKIALMSGIEFQEQEIETMKERSAYHGKYPSKVFSEMRVDDEEKAHEKVFKLYDRLETIRLHQQVSFP